METIRTGDDLEKEIEDKLVDDEMKDLANNFVKYLGRVDEAGIQKKSNILDKMLQKIMSKLPNSVKFIEMLDSDTPKVGFERLLLSEKVKDALLFFGNTYNEQAARIKYKTGQEVGDFRNYLDVLLATSWILVYFQKYRPDLYMVLTDDELNKEKCILGKLNSALVYIREELKKQPYKKYTVKKKGAR